MSMRRHPFLQHPMMGMLDWSPLSYFGGMHPFGGMFNQFVDPFQKLNRIMGRNLGGRNLGGKQWIGSQQQRPRQQWGQQRPQRKMSQYRPQQQRKLSQQRVPQRSRSVSQQRSLSRERRVGGPQLTQWSQKQQKQPKQPKQQQIKQKRPMIQQHAQLPQQQQQRQRPSSVACKMPQKYRISIDCSKLRIKSIKTNVREIKGKQVLVICAQTKENRDFRRQFVLPKNCNQNKLTSCVKPDGIFVVEFSLLEVPMISNIKLSPQIVRRGREQVVTLNLTIPHTVDLTKVQVCAKERDLIIRLEDKSSICSGSECATKCLFYNRIVLPVNTDHALLRCVQKKRKLIICAPLLSKSMGGYRCVPIHRKLRHRRSRKITATAKRTATVKKVSSQQQLQKKKVTGTPLKKVSSGVGIKKEKSATLLKQTAGKQKKSPLSSIGAGVVKSKNISSSSTVTKTKQPVLTQTPLAKSKKPSTSSKSKLIGSGVGRNIPVERVTSPTSPSSKRKSSGLVSKGSEVLQQIFGSSSGKSEELIGGRKSSLEL